MNDPFAVPFCCYHGCLEPPEFFRLTAVGAIVAYCPDHDLLAWRTFGTTRDAPEPPRPPNE